MGTVASRQIDVPTFKLGGGGGTSDTLAAVGLAPKEATGHIPASPQHAQWQIRTLCAVRLLQRHLRVGKAQAGNAVVVAIQRVFELYLADTAVGRHLTGIGRKGKDSDEIVAGSAFILPLELGIFACFVTIGQSVKLA